MDGVNLEIEQGQVVVVVGPSGCGKSTLLRCINALEPIQGGQVILEGKTVGKDNLEELRQKIGMVFQSYDLFPHLSVLDNITIAPIKVQKRKKEEVQAEARELLKRVGLEDKANSYPRQLSGGQKQRVAIVRALCMHPAPGLSIRKGRSNNLPIYECLSKGLCPDAKSVYKPIAPSVSIRWKMPKNYSA